MLEAETVAPEAAPASPQPGAAAAEPELTPPVAATTATAPAPTATADPPMVGAPAPTPAQASPAARRPDPDPVTDSTRPHDVVARGGGGTPSWVKYAVAAALVVVVGIGAALALGGGGGGQAGDETGGGDGCPDDGPFVCITSAQSDGNQILANFQRVGVDLASTPAQFFLDSAPDSTVDWQRNDPFSAQIGSIPSGTRICVLLSDGSGLAPGTGNCVAIEVS